MEEGDKKIRRENTVDVLVDAVLCEYEDCTNEEISYMGVEAITLEKDANNSNSENNIDVVSTEDKNKAISENVEALRTKYGSKYAISDNMVPVQTEDKVEDTRS